MPRTVTLFALLVLAAPGLAGEAERPVEWGTIAWERNFDAALARAETSGRDVLLLFQEVPG